MSPSTSLLWLLASLFALTAVRAAAYKTEYVVALDGSGDFVSIQDAIDDCKSFPYERITIRVKPGVYREKVTVPSWNPLLTIEGEGEVVVSQAAHFKSIDRGRNSTFFTATMEVLADDFIGRNLTVENAAGPVGQAIALRVEGDRCAFYDCRLLGNQDTLYVAGAADRQYFKNCYIEGTTDFIFGEATAFFEDCELRCKADSYLTAASTPDWVEHGFVFWHCRITAEPGIESVSLGRPWRRYAKTVYLGCEYGDFIAPKRWGDWGLEDPGATVFYGEYLKREYEADREGQAPWTHSIAAEDLASFSKARVLSGWNP